MKSVLFSRSLGHSCRSTNDILGPSSHRGDHQMFSAGLSSGDWAAKPTWRRWRESRAWPRHAIACDRRGQTNCGAVLAISEGFTRFAEAWQSFGALIARSQLISGRPWALRDDRRAGAPEINWLRAISAPKDCQA